MIASRRRLNYASAAAAPIGDTPIKLDPRDVKILCVYLGEIRVNIPFHTHKVIAVQSGEVPEHVKAEAGAKKKKVKIDVDTAPAQSTAKEMFTIGEHFVSVKSGGSVFAQGSSVMLIGVMFQRYKTDSGEERMGFEAKMIVPAFTDEEVPKPIDALPFLAAIPYEAAKVVPKDFTRTVIVQLDQVQAEEPPCPVISGKLLLPDNIPDTQLVIKVQGKPPVPGLTGEAGAGDIMLPLSMGVSQLGDGENDKQEEFVLQVYFGPGVVAQLYIPPMVTAPWLALARQFMPVLCGVVMGNIDGSKIIAGRDDAFVLNFPAVILYAAKIIERAGVEIDAASIPLFVPVANLVYPQWLGTNADLDMSANIINLCYAQGDATGVVELVQQGKAKAYVVSNHALNPAELRAEDMATRVQSLLGNTKGSYAYGVTKVFAVYVIGAGVRQALK